MNEIAIFLNANAFETPQQLYPHWVESLPIKTADEAEAIAKDYIQKRTEKTARDIGIIKVGFDGTFFTIHGYFTREGTLFDFGVKVDKEGNVVGWYSAKAPSF